MTPATEIGQLLAAARRAGEPFSSAWPAAVARALASVQGDEREQWAGALRATGPAWQAAWERRPATSALRALALVADGSDRVSIPEHACAHCGDELADDKRRGPPRLYCSARCRRDAHIARAA